MGQDSGIQWTHHTFNPWRGCTKKNAACTNCYAEVNYSVKMHGVKWGPNGTRVRLSDSGWREPLKWDRKAAKRGVRERVFCASLADVFEDWKGQILDHNGMVLHHGKAWGASEKYVPRDIRIGKSLASMDDLRRDLFELIDATPNLDWLLLTKRPENVLLMWPDDKFRKNAWLGTSIGNQETADEAIPHLVKCRGLVPVLFLSAEPLIGPVDLMLEPHPGMSTLADIEEWERRRIDWVIAGGESGPNARPCELDWIRSIVSQCSDSNVACFVKQLGAKALELHDGGITGNEDLAPYSTVDKKGGDWNEWPEELLVREFPACGVMCELADAKEEGDE